SLVVISTGTLLAALAASGVEAMAAALYYLVHSTLVAAGFFLLAAQIAAARGETGDSFVTGPALARAATVGAAYMVFALAICGVPPLSGFLGKLMIMRSIQTAPLGAAAWVALLVASLLPALVLARAASVFFWEPKPAPAIAEKTRLGLPALATLMLLAASPLLVAFAAPVADYARAAAEQLHSPETYGAVLGADPAISRERRP
ncbi:MAG: hypothetical protein HC900_13245, partial [Methylacidiphilales bacterium]|nr:hypothetical protein [Candidatus Methylacidiphilales bacterium]